jgi:hypothetical protein
MYSVRRFLGYVSLLGALVALTSCTYSALQRLPGPTRCRSAGVSSTSTWP